MKWKMTPSLTYNGGSGHSGTAASKARQEHRDATGKTSETQEQLLRMLKIAKRRGVTIAEVRESIPGQHHGSLSGALTNLNNDERIVLLAEKRGQCHVYVLPWYQGDRPLAVRRKRKCPNCGHDL